MAIKYQSGDFRHFIEVKRPSCSQNDEGGLEYGYSSLLTTWAAIKTTSNVRITDPTSLLDTKEFIIRYATERLAIKKDHILTLKGQDYTINGIQFIEEREKYIQLTCKARQGTTLVPNLQDEDVKKKEYTATGSETTLTYSDVINKTILYVGRSGVGVGIVLTGSPSYLEVLYNGSAGTFTFGSSLNTGERVLILYK